MSEWTWLKSHERVVLLAAALVGGYVGLNKWLNYDDMRKHEQLAVITQQVEQDKVALADAKAKADTDAAKYQQIIDTQTKQQALLIATIEADNALLKQRQEAVKTMPPTGVAQEWTKLVPEADVTIMNGQFTLSDAGARATVSQLEEIPVLQDQFFRELEVAKGKQQQIDAANGVIADKNNQLVVTNKLLVDAGKQCDDKVAVVKADARKSKRNWFLTGLTAGAAIALKIVGI